MVVDCWDHHGAQIRINTTMKRGRTNSYDINMFVLSVVMTTVFFYADDNALMTVSACDSHCFDCTVNGAGKCDVGKCFEKYAVDKTSLTCGGNICLVVYCKIVLFIL